MSPGHLPGCQVLVARPQHPSEHGCEAPTRPSIPHWHRGPERFVFSLRLCETPDLKIKTPCKRICWRHALFLISSQKDREPSFEVWVYLCTLVHGTLLDGWCLFHE